MQRVHFVPPVSGADLRLVLAQHTAESHDTYQLVYATQYGEVRRIHWLSKSEAHRRAAILKARGYRVDVARWS